MKITKAKLKSLIQEVMEENMPGEESGSPAVASGPSDSARATQKMGKVGGLDDMLAKVNSRQELEPFLADLLRKTQVKPQDIYTALINVAKAVKEQA